MINQQIFSLLNKVVLCDINNVSLINDPYTTIKGRSGGNFFSILTPVEQYEGPDVCIYDLSFLKVINKFKGSSINIDTGMNMMFINDGTNEYSYPISSVDDRVKVMNFDTAMASSCLCRFTMDKTVVTSILNATKFIKANSIAISPYKTLCITIDSKATFNAIIPNPSIEFNYVTRERMFNINMKKIQAMLQVNQGVDIMVNLFDEFVLFRIECEEYKVDYISSYIIG